MATRFTTRDLPTALKADGSDDSIVFTGYTVPTTAFTVAFWYFHVPADANDRILDWSGSGPTDGFTFNMSSAAIMAFSIKNGATTVANISTPTLINGRWYFIAGTYEVNSVKLYISDRATVAQTGSTDTSATMTNASAESLRLVRRSNASSNFSQCGMSDFMMFNAVLTLAEIEALFFTRTIPSSCQIHCPLTTDGTNLISGGVAGTVAGTPAFTLTGRFKARSAA
ncbi:hypothetical protein A2125_01485 [Candidatus Woesebacteria bacterium GWB1_43_5]|uniref:LamG-like jellyroll fold domain-containing protein n=1 Tax=Candidatus Woesebacteria bacterium GWB1_43_5 TaxID=1802474 RepID=A0A1F7WTA9_9BACT|nr:MAG: hypothetical protein A2125_01485 [Candidatus Woesebacteria bacterium GWB1_43_5]